MSFVKHDAGKLMMHLIEPAFLEGLAAVLTLGAAKYTADNWKVCPDPFARYYSALQRHLVAYAKGESQDPESGYSHLYHAAACLMFLAYFEAVKQERLAELAVADPLDEGGYKPHMPFVGLHRDVKRAGEPNE
jgi:hypothetical protein